MYLALTGEKTLRHFWRESPRSILYLAGRQHEKRRQEAERQMRLEVKAGEEIEE